MITSTSSMSLNVGSSVLSYDTMYPSTTDRDITDDMMKRFFQPIPPTGYPRVDLHQGCIVGKQGSGKTELMKFRAKYAIDLYGANNVNLVYTNDVRVGIDMMDSRSVQYLIIDDATSYASSREVHKQTDILKTFNKSRHVFEDKLNGKPGLILYEFAWQRWIELDPGFRDGDSLIFKTGMSGMAEKRGLVDILGEYYTERLYDIWDAIGSGDNDAKGISIGRIPTKDVNKGGVGFFYNDLVDFDFPDMICSDEYFGTEEGNVDLLDEYRSKTGWEKRIQCYEMYSDIANNMKQSEIAERLGVRQGYVSESVKKVRDLLRSR